MEAVVVEAAVEAVTAAEWALIVAISNVRTVITRMIVLVNVRIHIEQ